MYIKVFLTSIAFIFILSGLRMIIFKRGKIASKPNRYSRYSYSRVSGSLYVFLGIIMAFFGGLIMFSAWFILS